MTKYDKIWQMEENIVNLEDRLYTAPEVADILGVSLRTVYRYIKSGKLTFETKTRSGHYLFGKDAILSFLYPKKKKPGVQQGKLQQKELAPAKPLQFTTTGAVLPLHEHDILKSK